MANGTDKWSSRKYKTAWYLTTLTTLAFIGPHIASLFLEDGCSSTCLIDGAQWLTFLFGIWGIYFGANVAEKHTKFVSKDTSIEIQNKDPLADDKDGE